MIEPYIHLMTLAQTAFAAMPQHGEDLQDEFKVERDAVGCIMFFRASKHWNIDIEDKIVELGHNNIFSYPAAAKLLEVAIKEAIG